MEVWKPIKGYKYCDNYEVSNTGKVRNIVRGKELKGVVGKNGYVYVAFGSSKAKDRPYVSVHRLVAKHFLEPVAGKEIVNHKDHNRTNNHVDNLEWCTYQENNIHGECRVKDWMFQDLQGNVYKVRNLKQWCIVNNLSYKALHRMLTGHSKVSQGFTKI